MEFRVEIGEIRRDRERDNTDMGDSDTDTTDTLRPGGESQFVLGEQHFKVSAPARYEPVKAGFPLRVQSSNPVVLCLCENKSL